MNDESNELHKLAEDFVEYWLDAKKAEANYFSEGNDDIREYWISGLSTYTDKNIERVKKEYGIEFNNEKKEVTYLYSREYPVYLKKLDCRNHPFQVFLDDIPQYRDVMRRFRKKKIRSIVDWRYKNKELGPICLEASLDHFLAESIIRWHEIKSKGLDYFVKIEDKYIEKISKEARELLNAINDAPDALRISSFLIRGIEKLSNKEGSKYSSKLGSFEIPLDRYHIPRENLRYAPDTRHKKSGREFLVREMISKYMRLFGRNEIKKIDESIDLDLVEVVTRKFASAPQLNREKEYFKTRDVPIVHPDVIVSILQIIDIDFEDITERKIYDYASKQKQKDGYI